MNIIEELIAERTVVHSEGGNSMTPIIKSRQPVTLAPITDYRALGKDDIVLAKVNGRRVLHLIVATKKGQVQIGNNHGHINGWTTWDKVYGIVTHIDGKPRKNSQYTSP